MLNALFTLPSMIAYALVPSSPPSTSEAMMGMPTSVLINDGFSSSCLLILNPSANTAGSLTSTILIVKVPSPMSPSLSVALINILYEERAS